MRGGLGLTIFGTARSAVQPSAQAPCKLRRENERL